MAKTRTLKIWRGDQEGGEFHEYEVEEQEGMVVLDAIHRIQEHQANDLAVRWNCKAGKCGSCSVEINGIPMLSCMTRMENYKDGEPIYVQPLRTFPVIKDLVPDVSWNYEVKEKISHVKPQPRDENGEYRMYQEDVERIQEFRKCIECFLCQDVCHVLRDHQKKDEFGGPRFMIRLASLEMHPLDTEDRIPLIKNAFGSGYCNITKCCTTVCPESIEITDNGIIPLKERVVGRYYDPIARFFRKLFGRSS
jgi:succinate dehydrogenase / fumarate reductase iron-sulfur subunit